MNESPSPDSEPNIEEGFLSRCDMALALPPTTDLDSISKFWVPDRRIFTLSDMSSE
jgi:hypothetical protein